MRQIIVVFIIFLFLLSGCSFGKAVPDLSDLEGEVMTSEGAMSTAEYKTFVRSMDARINNAMNRVDNGIKQYREGTRTETEFISDIDYAISEMEVAANSFTTARPPVELVTGHILAVEGATYMKEGFVLMKTAVKNKNNDAYKQAVQQFSTGLQKIQNANNEYKNKLQGGFVMTLGNI